MKNRPFKIKHWQLKLALILFVAALTSIGWRNNPSRITTILLVRHAEKDTAQTDPPLSKSGRERAQELAHFLGEAGVKAIYTTQYLRTQQTVELLAKQLGVPIEVVNADPRNLKEHARVIVEKILSKHSGEVILISSHSNVMPLIMETFGVAKPPPIPDDEFDDLFVLTRIANGETALLRLKYGKPT